MAPQPTGPGLSSVHTRGLALLAFLSLAGCGGNPAGPSDMGGTPSITSVAPAAGTTLGGTTVVIAGANFATGGTVNIGGAAASNVNVLSSTQITATTGQHAAGVADVVVTQGTHSGRLTGAFTYVAPTQVTNSPPDIQSIVAQGSSRTNEPAQFADLSEVIDVTATVTDKETSPDLLAYQWSADSGTVTGTGPSVKWTAPASGAPLNATLTLTVVETYQSTDVTGLPVTLENRVTGTSVVSVHDSAKEVGDMATLFLVNFSKSEVPVDTVMQDFTPTCSGTAAERKNVEDNRAGYVITSWDVQPPQVTVNFQTLCQTVNGPRKGDACSNSKVRWDSTKLAGGTESVSGVDQIAAVYLTGRWWLCSSDFDGHLASGARFLGWGKR